MQQDEKRLIRAEEREALLQHATTIARQAARANGQGQAGAESAAGFIEYIFRQAIAARDAELSRSNGS